MSVIIFSSFRTPNVISFFHFSEVSGMGIDLELWRARIGMFHAARCRSQRRGKGGRIPFVQICLLALAVGMMVSLTPTVVNMLLLLGGDIESNPGPDPGPGMYCMFVLCIIAECSKVYNYGVPCITKLSIFPAYIMI